MPSINMEAVGEGCYRNPMTWPKDIPDAEVAELLAGIHFKTEPRRHQAISLIWASVAGRRLALWHDIGTGKSWTALNTHRIWNSKRILIVCPASVVESWEEQIATHTDAICCALTGSAADRQADLENAPARFFVLNYEGLQVLFGRRTKAKADKRSKWTLDRDAIRAAGFDGLVFDECHYLSNPKSQRSRVAYELSRVARQVIIMTGTSISTGEANLWGQFNVLDGGVSLSPSQHAFHKAHFKQDFFGKWTVREGESEAILARIEPHTLYYDKSECGDLPPRIYEERRTDPSAEFRRIERSIIEGEVVRLDGGTLGAVDAQQVANKLSQLSDGFLKLDDGTTAPLDVNPKADLLMETLGEVRGKVIVFHSYIASGRLIEARLEAARIPYASQRGEVKQVQRFMKDPECRVLVAHPLSGGIGLNLQMASCVIFYGNGTQGATVRAQAEGRIWRMGQTQRCLIFDLLLRGTLDEQRLERTQSLAEVAEKVRDYFRSRS